MMSDFDQSEESLYSDSDKDLGNASDVPILSEESEIEDDSGDEVAISSPQNIYQLGQKTHQYMVLLKLNLVEIRGLVMK